MSDHDAHKADQHAVATHSDEFPDVPDSENEAVVDLKKTFIITMVGSALFVGTVFAFIL